MEDTSWRETLLLSRETLALSDSAYWYAYGCWYASCINRRFHKSDTPTANDGEGALETGSVRLEDTDTPPRPLSEEH